MTRHVAAGECMGGVGGGWVGPGCTYDPLRPSVCRSANLHHHPRAHRSQFCRGEGRGREGGTLGGGSEAYREGLQTTDKLYTLP